MENKISILHLEDQEADSILVKSLISKWFSSFDYCFVDDEASFIKALEENKIDVILSDFELPDYSGSDALLMVKKQYPQIPFIFVTGKMGEDSAIESLLNGATDYVMKSKMERLVPAIKRVVYEAGLLQDRIASDKALRESEEKFRNLVENISDVIFEVDSQWRILYISPVIEKIMGFTPDDLVGTYFIKFVYEADRKSLINRFAELRQRVETAHEYRCITKTGDLCWVRTSIKANFEGEIFFGGSGTLIDITKRKQDEEALLIAKERAEASDRLKTAFMRNISHEIRTPLNGILGFGLLMSVPDLSAEEKDEFLMMVNESSDRLINTVTNIMDISLIVSGNQEVLKKEVAVGPLLDEIYKKFSPRCVQKRLSFTLQKHPGVDELCINSDPELLTKVLNHLLDNAIKFSKAGGITVGCQVKEKDLEFIVKDSGIGINLTEQSRIFDHFNQGDITNTRDHEGSGLGLSIARGLIELFGGRMWVDSVKGQGSSFYFNLPIEPTAIEKPAIQQEEAGLISKPLILIADDEEGNSLLLERILHKKGLDAMVVTDGQQAVDACRQKPAISLVLMDLKMPVMDGLEATKLIKIFSPLLPIIAITAYALGGDEKRALDAGCNAYLTKPLNKELLFKKLSQFGIAVTPP